jgi:hypothetical protein
MKTETETRRHGDTENHRVSASPGLPVLIHPLSLIPHPLHHSLLSLMLSPCVN